MKGRGLLSSQFGRLGSPRPGGHIWSGAHLVFHHNVVEKLNGEQMHVEETSTRKGLGLLDSYLIS